MYNSKPETFVYSIGFLSCCHQYCFVFVLAFGNEASHNLPTYIVFVCTLLFVLIFYSYAALCECNGRPDAVTLLLLVVTGTLFTSLSLAELLYYNLPMVTLCLPFFGIYFICCLILKKAILSIRIFSWSMFLMSWWCLGYLSCMRWIRPGWSDTGKYNRYVKKDVPYEAAGVPGWFEPVYEWAEQSGSNAAGGEDDHEYEI